MTLKLRPTIEHWGVASKIVLTTEQTIALLKWLASAAGCEVEENRADIPENGTSLLFIDPSAQFLSYLAQLDLWAAVNAVFQSSAGTALADVPRDVLADQLDEILGNVARWQQFQVSSIESYFAIRIDHQERIASESTPQRPWNVLDESTWPQN